MRTPFVVEALTFAQHYRIPTSLLDWTGSGLVAAYFVARGYLDSERRYDRFAIWGIHRHASEFSDSKRLRIVEPTRYSNINVRAQHGYFTYDSKADKFFDEVKVFDSHDMVLFHDLPPNRPKSMLITKIVCPRRIAENLLSILYLEGVTRATIFPSLDSVALSVLEEIDTATRAAAL
jgi:hypothetical protein